MRSSKGNQHHQKRGENGKSKKKLGRERQLSFTQKKEKAKQHHPNEGREGIAASPKRTRESNTHCEEGKERQPPHFLNNLMLLDANLIIFLLDVTLLNFDKSSPKQHFTRKQHRPKKDTTKHHQRWEISTTPNKHRNAIPPKGAPSTSLQEKKRPTTCNSHSLYLNFDHIRDGWI